MPRIKAKKMFAATRDLSSNDRSLVLHETSEWGNTHPVGVIPLRNQKQLMEQIAEAIHGYKAAPSTNKQFYLSSSLNVLKALGLHLKAKK